MIYTRIAFPHFKFHIEERKECSSLLTLAWSKRVIIPIFCLKPVLSEKQSNNFYICKTRVWLEPVCIDRCVWVCTCVHAGANSYRPGVILGERPQSSQ